jgi:co-chaperonin GroES (HSP10)
MQAMKNKIIIKKDPKKDTITDSGIIVVRGDTWGEWNKATIISVGSEITTVKNGDRIAIREGVGENIEGPDKLEYHIIKEDDIDALVTEE